MRLKLTALNGYAATGDKSEVSSASDYVGRMPVNLCLSHPSARINNHFTAGLQQWVTSRGRLGRCVHQILNSNDAAEVRLMANHWIGLTRPRPRCNAWEEVSTPLHRPKSHPRPNILDSEYFSHAYASAAFSSRVIRALCDEVKRRHNLARRFATFPYPSFYRSSLSALASGLFPKCDGKSSSSCFVCT